MTPAEQIAEVRQYYGPVNERILAVCDLAERALLTDDEREAVRQWVDLEKRMDGENIWLTHVVMRRLLGG
jgi:hypothetical protein